MVKASLPEPGSSFCLRCDSVGHTVEACPFGLGDAYVMNVAQLRRERRASAGGLRRKVV